MQETASMGTDSSALSEGMFGDLARLARPQGVRGGGDGTGQLPGVGHMPASLATLGPLADFHTGCRPACR